MKFLMCAVWQVCFLSWLAVGALPARADVQTEVVDSFRNYYGNEGIFNWAKNCRIVADLPSMGTPLPANVRLQFIFEHDQERLAVFQRYSRGTVFDLGFSTETSPFSYQQRNAATSVSGSSATVSFSAFTLQSPAGGTGQLSFEIYGDCNICGSREALPPDGSHTTWKNSGKIDVAVDSSNNVTRCRLIDIASEQPQKHLPSRDPQYYPARKVPVQRTFNMNTNAMIPPMECWCREEACLVRSARCRLFRARRRY